MFFPAYGTVTYGAFTFPGTYNITIKSQPIYNTANTGTKYVRHSITIKFILSREMAGQLDNGYSVDELVDWVRNQLLQPRQALILDFQGAGTAPASTDLQGPTTTTFMPQHDFEGGPSPQSFEWRPLGVNNAVEITWTINVSSRWCYAIDQWDPTFKIIDFFWDRRFDLGDEGQCTVTTKGKVETRLGEGAAADFQLSDYVNSIDSPVQRSLFYFLPPVGFRRVRQSYAVNETNTAITFEIVDEEIPSENALFPYSVMIEATHSMGSSLTATGSMSGRGFLSWDNEINVRVRLAPSFPSSLAYLIFLWIVSQRYNRIKRFGPADNDTKLGRVPSKSETDKTEAKEGFNNKPRNILISLRMRENIYRREHDFNAKYLGVYALDKLLEMSGMFTPVYTIPDQNGKNPWEEGYNLRDPYNSQWLAWRASVDRILRPYGYRGAHQPIGIIFDPCAAGPRAVAPFDVINDEYLYNTPGKFTDPDDIKDETYIDYQCSFALYEDSSVHQIGIQDKTSITDGYNLSTEQEAATMDAKSVDFLWSGKRGADQQQTAHTATVGGSKFILTCKGMALRLKWPALAPVVISVAGFAVRRMPGALIEQKQVARGANPVYATRWNIRYAVNGLITEDVFNAINTNAYGGLITTNRDQQ